MPLLQPIGDCGEHTGEDTGRLSLPFLNHPSASSGRFHSPTANEWGVKPWRHLNACLVYFWIASFIAETLVAILCFNRFRLEGPEPTFHEVQHALNYHNFLARKFCSVAGDLFHSPWLMELLCLEKLALRFLLSPVSRPFFFVGIMMK